MVYGRGIIKQAGTTAHCQQMFRLSSMDWHRFLGFWSVDGGIDIYINIYKRKRVLWEEEADERQIMRRHRLNTMDMTQVLRQIIGKETIQFCGVQAAALQTIQDGESSVVAVIQTGRGKSILFILPVFAEPSGTTIVIVPLILLYRDIMRRCQILDILCILWKSCRLLNKTTIVLVIPESAVTKNFYIFINRLKQTRQLDRIVIDECYVILNNQQNFRPELYQLRQLNYIQIQIVLLTAILFFILKERLFQQMEYQADQVYILRNWTSCPNVVYCI